MDVIYDVLRGRIYLIGSVAQPDQPGVLTGRRLGCSSSDGSMEMAGGVSQCGAQSERALS